MKLMAKLTLMMGALCVCAFLSAPTLAHSSNAPKYNTGPKVHANVAKPVPPPKHAPAGNPPEQGPSPCG